MAASTLGSRGRPRRAWARSLPGPCSSRCGSAPASSATSGLPSRLHGAVHYPDDHVHQCGGQQGIQTTAFSKARRQPACGRGPAAGSQALTDVALAPAATSSIPGHSHQGHLPYCDGMVTEITGESSLTKVEQALVDHVTRGELLDLAAEPAAVGQVTEATMRSWGSSRTVRAAVLRDILRGRLAHPSQPPLDANRLSVTVLDLSRAVITADCKAGAVRLRGAHLSRLYCIDTTIRNDAGAALNAGGLQVDQDVYLRGGFEAIGAGSGVTLDLSHVRIGGVLEFAPARLEHTADPQARLALDGLTYTGLPARISSHDWLRLLREAT